MTKDDDGQAAQDVRIPVTRDGRTKYFFGDDLTLEAIVAASSSSDPFTVNLSWFEDGSWQARLFRLHVEVSGGHDSGVPCVLLYENPQDTGWESATAFFVGQYFTEPEHPLDQPDSGVHGYCMRAGPDIQDAFTLLAALYRAP